jgi:hypothetical protein
MTSAPNLHVVEPGIEKPKKFDLSKYESRKPADVSGVTTMQATLPCHSIAQAKDFVRMHPSDDYWSNELCFVNVPTPGMRDTKHLIIEDLAGAHLPAATIERKRLVLAAKPGDVFFLCEVPTRNLDNKYNADNVAACERARRLWVKVASLRDQGLDGYETKLAADPDAFPEPRWPRQTLFELIEATFGPRVIDEPTHPGLLRLIGAKIT